MVILRLQLLPPPLLRPTPTCPTISTKCFLPSTTMDTGLLFREKLLYLEDLNVDPQKALRLNPSIRSTPLSSILSVESVLSAVGLSRSSVGRILDMYPNLLTSDPDSVISPVIHFLADEIRIPTVDIPKSLRRCPRLLVSSVDLQLRPALSFLETLGFVGRYAINSRTTVLLVSSVEQTLIPKIEYLQGLGFTREEVATMVVRSPGLLTFSVENNLVPKVEYFVEEMRGDLEELKRFPQYFSFSLERKIKPRHGVLKEQNIHMPLSEMLKVSDGEFITRLIELRLSSVDGRNLMKQ